MFFGRFLVFVEFCYVLVFLVGPVWDSYTDQTFLSFLGPFDQALRPLKHDVLRRYLNSAESPVPAGVCSVVLCWKARRCLLTTSVDSRWPNQKNRSQKKHRSHNSRGCCWPCYFCGRCSSFSFAQMHLARSDDEEEEEKPPTTKIKAAGQTAGMGVVMLGFCHKVKAQDFKICSF